MRSEAETNRALSLYGDMVRRICFVHLKNRADTEDIFQTVYFKYLLHTKAFENESHEKAWFARVTINACKDLLKSTFSKHVSLEEVSEEAFAVHPDQESGEVLDAVLSLPPKYRDVIYLCYFEGYSAVEVSRILHRSENTIYTWLSRAKKLLREQLGGVRLG